MNRFIALASLSLLASVVRAQVTTYDYTGNLLSETSSGVSVLTPLYLSGNLVLSNPLNPNEANQIVTPLSFDFVSQNDFLSSAAQSAWNAHTSSEQVSSSFEFSTVNGNITAWNVALAASTPGTNDGIVVNENLVNATGKVNGLSPAVGDLYYAQSNGVGSPISYSVSGQNYNPGTWVDPPSKVTPAKVPELSESGFVDSILFLFCAIMVLLSKINFSSVLMNEKE
jgi:hypothetical protein